VQIAIEGAGGQSAVWAPRGNLVAMPVATSFSVCPKNQLSNGVYTRTVRQNGAFSAKQTDSSQGPHRPFYPGSAARYQ
jgi:hypothetical protein